MLSIVAKHNKALQKLALLKQSTEEALEIGYNRVEELEGEIKQHERAREIMAFVMSFTQRQVTEVLTESVALALSSVYGPDYGFVLDFQIKRNQSEITPMIIIEGKERSTREEIGGGVLDVASLAFRLALWSIMEPRPGALFIFDEPGRFLHQDKQEAFGQMLSQISSLLGIQIILVSHSEGIIECADNSYQIVKEEGISKVVAFD